MKKVCVLAVILLFLLPCALFAAGEAEEEAEIERERE
jgi:hypothetical protein